MNEPTSRPWRVEKTGSIEYSIYAGMQALPLATGLFQEDAELIVRCVNAHDEMVAALKFILAFYEPGQTHLDTEAWKRAEASGRAALAKARGTS